MSRDTPDYAARQRELASFVNRLVFDDLRSGGSTFDFDRYWLSFARSPEDRVLRRASLSPLARVASDGAWVWIDGERRWRARVGKELYRHYQTPSPFTDPGGMQLHVVEPARCEHACCDYRSPRVGCHLGGPADYILARACFDASGAATDYFLGVDSEADGIADPDVP